MDIANLAALPQSLGFDVERLQRAEAVLRRGLAEGVFPAAVYLVMRQGRIAAQGALGLAQPDADPPIPAWLDTVFDMASLTKPITATLLLMCVEEGRLHLGQQVADFLPEAAGTPIGPITLRQLATHTSGLPAWKPLYAATPPSAVVAILAAPLEAEPGTRYTYSDLGYILLGEILARVTGLPLDRLARERIFAPLGMERSGFCPEATLHPFVAATANCPWRKDQVLIGQVHDANAHSMGGISGHAGLFSTAPDMARFALAFRNAITAAQLDLPPLLGPLARQLAERSQIDPAIGGHSIGWFTPPNGMLPRGDLLSERAYGHTGFTGTLLLFDPETDLTLLLLTNRVYSSAEGAGIGRVRRLFVNAVAGAIRA
ncbi:MAG TPA: serine hydrolase domain-containing protein [Chthonomonadaceae bacterium]|nr:serine hydrolase domain-containing protein [Chthonomonadaceae bacterium]